MAQIILNDAQASVVREAGGELEVLDGAGRMIGMLFPQTDDEAVIVAEAKRRLATPGRRYTTAEVLTHLRSLETR
jgi:hypothetical protein